MKKPNFNPNRHPITGHVIPSVVKRKEEERPAKEKKLKPSNWGNS